MSTAAEKDDCLEELVREILKLSPEVIQNKDATFSFTFKGPKAAAALKGSSRIAELAARCGIKLRVDGPHD
jgi:hypothetical protein